VDQQLDLAAAFAAVEDGQRASDEDWFLFGEGDLDMRFSLAE